MCFLSLLILNYACSSQKIISIKSIPEGASVVLINGGKESKSLGVTPLEVLADEFRTKENSIAIVQLSKEQFEDSSLLLVADQLNGRYEININLKQKNRDTKVDDIQKRQEKLAQVLMTTGHQIYSKRYEEAKVKLLNLSQEFPYISVIYDVIGNFYYLQKDLKNALENYEKSSRLNPENAQTKTMIDKLKEMQKG